MRVGGDIQVPGDKSLTHRALMLGAMARGTSFIRGALTSLDARSTARVLRQLGAEVSPLAPGRVTRVGDGEGSGVLMPVSIVATRVRPPVSCWVCSPRTQCGSLSPGTHRSAAARCDG